MSFHVDSVVGELRQVIVHRPYLAATDNPDVLFMLDTDLPTIGGCCAIRPINTQRLRG